VQSGQNLPNATEEAGTLQRHIAQNKSLSREPAYRRWHTELRLKLVFKNSVRSSLIAALAASGSSGMEITFLRMGRKAPAFGNRHDSRTRSSYNGHYEPIPFLDKTRPVLLSVSK